MLQRGRILIVDDEPDTLGLIELTLKTAGYVVETAVSAEQALLLLDAQQYDLLLLDVMMPGLTGFDMVRTLQKRGKDLPAIIFLTAKGSDEDRKVGESLQASAYLVKPATRGKLLDAIRRALEQASRPDAQP
jgi:DNA-binding response OmpR family regulator